MTSAAGDQWTVAGTEGGVPFGMAFAFGWVLCVGPVLATILATAASTQTAPWGAALLALYSLGLGIPFVAMGVWFQGLRRSVDWLRRHAGRIEQAAGVLLVGVGALFISRAWRSFFIPLQRAFARLGWPPI